MSMGTDVTVIIVVFHNSAKQLIDCYTSLKQSCALAGVESEVMFVLNEGEVPSELTDSVSVLDHRLGNVGYAVAVNLGINEANSPMCLVLNPDVKMKPDTIGVMFKYLRCFDNRDRVLFTAIQFNNSEIQVDAYTRWFTSTGHFIQHRLEKHRLQQLSNQNGLVKVAKIPGSSMLGSKKLLQELGPYDTNFFLYGEDVDMSIRASKSNISMYLVTGAQLEHDASSSQTLHGALVERARADAALRLVEKHKGVLAAYLAAIELTLVTIAGALVATQTSSHSYRIRLERLRVVRNFLRHKMQPPRFRSD